MPAANTIRYATFAAIIAGLKEILAPGDDWDWTEASFSSGPNEAPKAAGDSIGVYIEVAGRPIGPTPDRTFEAPDVDTTLGMFVRDVESLVRLEADGPKAASWLDTFLVSLTDLETITFFRDLGFSVEDDGGGAVDVAAIIGARQQVRYEAYLRVGCRVIRDRVINGADTVQVAVTWSDAEHADLETTSDFDVEVEP